MNELKIKGKLFINEPVKTKTGMNIFSGSLMLSRKDKKTDQWLNSFVPVKAFNEAALHLMNVEHKSTVILTGKLGVDDYTDKKTGDKKTQIYILAFSYELVKAGFKVDKEAVDDVKAYDLGKIIDDSDIPF